MKARRRKRKVEDKARRRNEEALFAELLLPNLQEELMSAEAAMSCTVDNGEHIGVDSGHSRVPDDGLSMYSWADSALPTPVQWNARTKTTSFRGKERAIINNAQERAEGTPSKFSGLAKWFKEKLRRQTGVIDSGATGHFLQKGVGIPTGRCSSKVVGMPNGKTETATQQVLLPIDTLGIEARQGDELPSLQHNNLVSVPTFSDYGYTTIFKPYQMGCEVYESTEVDIVPRGEPVLRGWRDVNGLFRTQLGSELDSMQAIKLSQDQVNSIYHLPSVESRVAFIHASLGFPTKAAMLDAAASGRLVGIPFATVTNIRKFYPETKATPKGHLDQQQQGVRSTKAAQSQGVNSRKTGIQLTPERDVHVAVWELKHTTYSDQTGRFPYTSYKGNKYVMVLVEIDSSAILVKPLCDKTAEEMTRAYLHLLQRIKAAGLRPRKHIMDNEVSEVLKETIEKECKLELVPPGCHRRNVAEVAIKSFKAHFIAILAGLPKSFPMRLWCQLLPQAEMTINILRPSHARPGISAHSYLFGQFDFNRTPLAPIGCKVQCHAKPGDRGTWEEHSADGWFLGCSKLHYRTFLCYI
jgi:hypothetical protein